MAGSNTQQNLRTTLTSRPPEPQLGRNHITFVCNDTKTLYLFRREVIIELVRANYQVTIVAPFDEYVEYFIAEGVQFHQLTLSRQGRNVLEDYRSYQSLRRAYKNLKPDIIFHYTIKVNIYGTLAASKLGIPSISVVPGLGHFPDADNRLFKALLAKGYEKAARNSTEIWFLNSHDHGYFEAKGWLEKTNCRILPGEGINTRTFYYKAPLRNKVPSVLYLGRLLINKGARTFAQAAKRSKRLGINATFKMVGFIDESHSNGIKTKELNSWTKKGWITYGGSTNSPQSVLEQSDIIVVPTNYREGLNRVIQEALAIGRPVITTAVPGAGELVEHNKTGYIVPPNNPNAIVDVLQLFLSYSREKQEKMGQLGSRSVSEKYDVNNVLPHYWDAIARHCKVSNISQ